MTARQAVAFVKNHGVALEAARSSVPSLAHAIAGGPIRGSWWAHPRGREIFAAARAIGDSPDVLVCRLVEGKTTYVHRRLWPALVKINARFRRAQVARVWEEHTPAGAHRSRRIPFPRWVPSAVMDEARRLSVTEAEALWAPWLPFAQKKTMGPRARRTGR